jgi:hypothetical protein
VPNTTTTPGLLSLVVAWTSPPVTRVEHGRLSPTGCAAADWALDGALLITARVQNVGVSIHVLADRIKAMPVAGQPVPHCHDFR